MRDGFRHYINPDELDVLRRMLNGATEDLSREDRQVFRLLVRRMEEDVAEQSSEEMRAVRMDGIRQFVTDDVQVDDDAEIITVDAGYWLQGWLWMAR
jgi:uncharacterized protein (UPF0216 family)